MKQPHHGRTSIGLLLFFPSLFFFLSLFFEKDDRKENSKSFWLVSWKATMDGVKFINFSCLKIEQNHTSSCSLPVITYESILGLSYTSSFFMQIRLKKILLAVLLLKNLAKYNKEINMTVKFLLITFK